MSESNQAYIGTPNGIVLCVESMERKEPQGTFYHYYSRRAVAYRDYLDLVMKMEKVFDRLKFPNTTTNYRSFDNAAPKYMMLKEPEKVMSNETLLGKHGALGTFIVRVQHRQNSTWQGTVTWTDRNKTEYFRSIYELIKLVGSALDLENPPSPEDEDVTFESDEQ